MKPHSTSGIAMESLPNLKLDEFFTLWLSDPLTDPIWSAVSAAAVSLQAGSPHGFDFAVFDFKSRRPQAQRPARPPTLSTASLNLLPAPPSRSPRSSLAALDVLGQDIPKFYGPETDHDEVAALSAVVGSGKLDERGIAKLLRQFCHLPGSFARVLFQRDFTPESFQQYWTDNFVGVVDPNERFLRLLVGRERPYIFPNDLLPFVRIVVETHPSLAFLKDEHLFQEKFIEFIACRCFFIMDYELRGIATIHQMRNMDLAGAFFAASTMPDVNETHQVFNYQHFYVAFCRFWDLDTDNDGFITKDDLLKLNESSVSPVIIDRFFRSPVYPGSGSHRQVIDFSAFSYFLMSLEDKLSPTAIRFWYKLCDLDEDGILSMKEIRELYETQLERMRITGNETIPFGDMLRQLWDMINPADPLFITVADLVRCQLSDVFFSALFDLQKFLLREYQFPYSNPNLEESTKRLSAWDLFVMFEYEQLVNEN
jgi:serine/threonine-protein phosphatase 2A regulatory subunit B''